MGAPKSRMAMCHGGRRDAERAGEPRPGLLRLPLQCAAFRRAGIAAQLAVGQRADLRLLRRASVPRRLPLSGGAIAVVRAHDGAHAAASSRARSRLRTSAIRAMRRSPPPCRRRPARAYPCWRSTDSSAPRNSRMACGDELWPISPTRQIFPASGPRPEPTSMLKRESRSLRRPRFVHALRHAHRVQRPEPLALGRQQPEAHGGERRGERAVVPFVPRPSRLEPLLLDGRERLVQRVDERRRDRVVVLPPHPVVLEQAEVEVEAAAGHAARERRRREGDRRQARRRARRTSACSCTPRRCPTAPSRTGGRRARSPRRRSRSRPPRAPPPRRRPRGCARRWTSRRAPRRRRPRPRARAPRGPARGRPRGPTRRRGASRAPP